MAKTTALLIGASGLIGNLCLQLLLNDDGCQQVTVLVRKPLTIKHPKLIQRQIDFAQLTNISDEFKVDHVFCCLGTTIKTAGSKPAFRRVDFDYPLALAKLAKQQGAAKFLLVTALGANAKSAHFYSQVKGEVEQAIAALGLTSVHIFQPSLLLGHRPNDFRLIEAISQSIFGRLSFIFVGPLRKYRPITAQNVAQAMLAIAKHGGNGVVRYESDQIARIAK